jgi:hypothetical protein
MTLAMAKAAGIACAEEMAKGANAPDTDDARKPGAEGFFQMLGLLAFGQYTWKRDQMAQWHFPADDDGIVRPDSAVAQRDVRLASNPSSCQFTMFSEGLHILQDSWAHQGRPIWEPWNGKIGHGRGVKQVTETITRSYLVNSGPYLDWATDTTQISHYELDTGPLAGTDGSADEVKLWQADARATAEATYKWLLTFKKNCPCHCPGNAKTSSGPEVRMKVITWINENAKEDNVVPYTLPPYRPKSVPTAPWQNNPDPSTPIYN